jgi:hypothetical protein
MFKNRHQEYFPETNLLCHYTRSDTLLKILSSMKLRFSEFKNLNDLNENEVNFQISDLNLEVTIKDYIIKNCRLLSFTKDTFNKNGLIDEWGINHPRMWAQYAEDNKGACIVLNEKKLLQNNPELKDSKFYAVEDVEYNLWNLSDDVEDFRDAESLLKGYYKKIFFKKSKDWELERERRIFQIGDFEYLDINNCVEYICLGFRFNQYGELIDLISDNFKNNKQILTPHDFAIQLDSYGSINAIESSNIIMRHLKKGNSFLDYLKENGY